MTPVRSSTNTLLRVSGLHAWHGKSHVLQGVDLELRAGEIVSLLGRNGAGRSTMVRSIMGLVRCAGSIRFKGEELLGLAPYEIAHRGMGYVPEGREIFPTLTVRQNLLLGMKGRRPGRWSFDDLYRMFPLLRQREHVQAGVLSGGEQQMLTLCRTLIGDPGLILVDEPTEGLAPRIVEQVANWLKELRNQGVAILLVEQKLAIALEISDRIYVMGQGRIRFEGTPDELAGDAGVRREWLEV